MQIGVTGTRTPTFTSTCPGPGSGTGTSRSWPGCCHSTNWKALMALPQSVIRSNSTSRCSGPRKIWFCR